MLSECFLGLASLFGYLSECVRMF